MILVLQDEVKGLEFISRLQPVTYNYDIYRSVAKKIKKEGNRPPFLVKNLPYHYFIMRLCLRHVCMLINQISL